AEQYLREQRWVSARERVRVRQLAGGVSNEVLYVARLDRLGADFVLKQARPQLRTPEPWFSSVERIWREIDVLHACQRVLLAEPIRPITPPHTLLAATPRVLHEDRENYAFAMTAAPPDHRVWKADLLGGRVEPIIADACGRLLGRLHAGTWHDAQVADQLDDRRLFDELRLDPYYRQVARVCPEHRADFERLIDTVLGERHCLVHADFSPKNLLVYNGGLLLVDFETGHYGDPAFDLGFFLSHLVLKAAYHAPGHQAYLALTTRFWKSYQAELEQVIADGQWHALRRRAIMNFAGCAWARLDGKSQIDYLPDEGRRSSIRDVCRNLLDEPVADWQQVVDELHARLA
ncbi:MAG: phosphotransferase family protein, partial [Candidatus Saccharimonadales bacterium]